MNVLLHDNAAVGPKRYTGRRKKNMQIKSIDTSQKSQKRCKSAGVQQVSQYCFFLSEHTVCIHIRKNKSGNPPTNPLGFLYAHGCGCPWFPSLAPYRSSVFWSSVFLCKNLLLRFKKMSPLKDRVGAWNSWRPVPSTGTGAPSLKVRLLHPPSRSLRGFR